MPTSVVPAQPDAPLTRIVEGVRGALVSLDGIGRVTAWDDAARELFGIPGELAVGRLLDELLVPRHLHDQCADGLRGFLDGHEAAVAGRRLALPAAHADGRELPVELTVAAVPTPAGPGFCAYLHDVTERSAATHQAELLASIVHASADAIFGSDRDGVIVSWNPAAEELFGYREAEAVGRHVAMLRLAGQQDLHAVISGKVIERELPFRGDVRHRHRDGHAVEVSLTVSPLRDATGAVIGRSAVARDISERRRSEEHLIRYTGELKERTSQDPQTGLPAARELHRSLAARIEAGVPFALVLLGATGLNERNERHGYAAGDHALRTMATTAGASVRGSDEVFRCSGATLAVVMTAEGSSEALEASRRIQATLAGADPELQVAAGCASWPEGAADPDGLLRAARQALEADSARQAAVPAATTRTRSRLSPPVMAAVERLLETTALHLGLDVAWLSEFTQDEQIVRGLAGDATSFGMNRDGSLPLNGAFSVTEPDAGTPAAGRATDDDASARALPLTDETGMGAYVGAPVLLRDGSVYGMVCAAARQARPGAGEADARALELLAALVADRLDEQGLATQEHRVDVEDTGVAALLAALDARDHYTGDHSEAVVSLSSAVARHLGLGAKAVGEVEQVARLHDIGKVGIPDAVLRKQGPLTELEWDLMRQHSALGARIVASIGSLAHLAPAVRAEHERWDGTGYPDGLSGCDIPLTSRIIFASDAFHAMTSDRPYRRALAAPAAVEELRAGAGSQFDADVVEALIAVVAQPDCGA